MWLVVRATQQLLVPGNPLLCGYVISGNSKLVIVEAGVPNKGATSRGRLNSEMHHVK